MRKQTPEKINRLVGYRSRRSMKNVETWKFANEYCGRLWWRIGWVMFLFSGLVQIPFMHSSEDKLFLFPVSSSHGIPSPFSRGNEC